MDLIDERIGARVRDRRRQLRMSQAQVAEICGITYQQIQKYEKGLNRVSAGRLARIAVALGVPPTYFYDFGLETDTLAEGVARIEIARSWSGGAQSAADLFDQIKTPAVRKAVLTLLEALTRAEAPGNAEQRPLVGRKAETEG